MYVCFSIDQFIYLVSHKIIPIKQRPDYKNSDVTVWEFRKCDELYKILNDYKMFKKKGSI